MKGTAKKCNKILKGDNEGTQTIGKRLETENEQTNLKKKSDLKHLKG